jgi:hypothetical protein
MKSLAPEIMPGRAWNSFSIQSIKSEVSSLSGSGVGQAPNCFRVSLYYSKKSFKLRLTSSMSLPKVSFVQTEPFRDLE